MAHIDDVVIVLTTVPGEFDGEALGRTLVGEGLAACVSVLPEMVSVYRWQGQVDTAREQQLLIKATRHRLAALEGRVRALHPYDVPEWLVLGVSDGSAAYLAWVRDSTRSDI